MNQQLLDDYSLHRGKKRTPGWLFPSNDWLFPNHLHNLHLLKECQLIWLYYSKLNHEGKWNIIHSKATYFIIPYSRGLSEWLLHPISLHSKIVSILRGSYQRGPRTLGDLYTILCMSSESVRKRREKRPQVMLQSWWGSQAIALPGSLVTAASRASKDTLRWAREADNNLCFPGISKPKDLLRILISTSAEMETLNAGKSYSHSVCVRSAPRPTWDQSTGEIGKRPENTDWQMP